MQASKVSNQTHFLASRLRCRQSFQLKFSQALAGPKAPKQQRAIFRTSAAPCFAIDRHGSLLTCILVPTASVSGAAPLQINHYSTSLARKPSCTRPHAGLDQGYPTADSDAGGDGDTGGGGRGRYVRPASGGSGGGENRSGGEGNEHPEPHWRARPRVAMFLLSPVSTLLLQLHPSPPALTAAPPAASEPPATTDPTVVPAAHLPSASIPVVDVAPGMLIPATGRGGGRDSQHGTESEGLAAAAAVANAPHQRMKRLLREVFAELTEHRARLEAMEAAADDTADAAAAGESLVLPMEGFAVRPYSRALASGLRLRCRAQVSGTVEVPALIPLAATVTETTLAHSSPGTGSPAAAPSLDRAGDFRALDWADMAAVAGLSATPRIRFRIQSLWGSDGDGLHEKRSAAGASGAASTVNVLSAWQQIHQHQQQQERGPPEGISPLHHQDRQQQHPQLDQEASKASAHLQFGLGAAGGHGEQLSVEKLMLKAEVSPRLRVLLAARGSLDNIGKNANPYATASGGPARGLTGAMQRGHDLVLLAQQGAGVAVAAAAGSLSSAFGVLTHGSLLSTIPTAASFTTCGQLSLHRSRRLALTAACSTTSPYSAALLDPADVAAPVPYRGAGIQDCDGAGGAGGGGEGRLLQRGIIGTMQLGSRLSAAVWFGDATTRTDGPTSVSTATVRHSADVSGDGEDPGSGPLGPWQDGAPAHEASCLYKRCRQRRMGLRLSTLPDEDTGRSYALCVSHRAQSEASETGGGGGSSPRSELLIVEASASLPVAHGVVVTPGLVLLQSGGPAPGGYGTGGRTLFAAVASTNWSF